MHQRREVEFETVLECLAYGRVIPADIAHCISAEKVEIAIAFVVPKVLPLRSDIHVIESDRLEDAGKLRVDVLREEPVVHPGVATDDVP